MDLLNSFVNNLYIPHSSDKTQVQVTLGDIFENFFTSHIVQIKPGLKTSPYVAVIKDFTSHIVQIKLVPDGRFRTINLFLYIPHSSDKTRFLKLIHETLSSIFTSHIVQIKLRALTGYMILFLLYIPHSSDKTQHLPPKSNIDNTPILEFCQVVQVK